jgi:hypothetical protein
MKLAALLLLIGVAIIGYAASIPPYTDEKLFMERYMALSVGQSKEYWKLRDEMLTVKFQLQDYGGTFIAAAVGFLLVSRRGWRGLNAPKARSALVLLALAAPVLTIGAYVYDLSLGFVRGEFPHWADSMSIPLMGTPVLFAILLAWSAGHLAFLRGVYCPMPLYVAISRKANWWLLFVAALTAMLVALCTVTGVYWYAIAGVSWLIFYLSLAAVRSDPHDAEPCGQPDLAHKAAQGRLP